MVNKRNKRPAAARPAKQPKTPSKRKALKGGWQEQWRYALRGLICGASRWQRCLPLWLSRFH